MIEGEVEKKVYSRTEPEHRDRGGDIVDRGWSVGHLHTHMLECGGEFGGGGGGAHRRYSQTVVLKAVRHSST